MGDRKREEALENLSNNNINVIYESRKEKLTDTTRDINAGGVTVNFYGKSLIEEIEVEIKYGNRYGFIWQNSSGKYTIMKAIVVRAITIPDKINVYFWDDEVGDKTAIFKVFEGSMLWGTWWTNYAF